MIMQVLALTAIILILAGLLFGLKFFFTKEGALPTNSCGAQKAMSDGGSCGCGGGHCENS